ncbi:MAG TPA: TMEM175 family protein [Steroidobacteraceae bacterium]|nr:TMEM175 family protein [Steroidobacteraceae bacterium]
MVKGRMEAFSDGVIAILITIMVLELRPPDGTTLASLGPIAPTLGCYVLSFVFIAIYWNNHHHLLQAVKQVTGPILWANMHLLFWLSLVPFVTDWMGEHFASGPVAAYGVVLLCAGTAYYILARLLIATQPDSALARAVGSDVKGQISVVIYAVAIVAAFYEPWVSCALYVCVAILWLVPDRRIERELTHH